MGINKKTYSYYSGQPERPLQTEIMRNLHIGSGKMSETKAGAFYLNTRSSTVFKDGA